MAVAKSQEPSLRQGVTGRPSAAPAKPGPAPSRAAAQGSHAFKQKLIGSLVVQSPGDAADGATSPTSPSSGPDGGVKVWKAALLDMLKACEGAQELYRPVGRFWLVEDHSAPKAAAAKVSAPAAMAAGAPGQGRAKAEPVGGWDGYKQDNVVLSLLPVSRTEAAGVAAFRPDNPQLIARWEFGLEDFRKDLMEVFAWVTFKSKTTIEGRQVERAELMRPISYLE